MFDVDPRKQARPARGQRQMSAFPRRRLCGMIQQSVLCPHGPEVDDAD